MPTDSLDVIERWMQSVIMHPDGVEAGINSDQAQRHIALSPNQIETVVTRSRSLSSIERLEVYANAYFARLSECLREEFPALVHALGGDAFDEIAAEYLRECPSTSYTLARLGARFPGFLARSLPDALGEEGQNSEGCRQWTSFLVELAQVERVYSEVFDGPGIEGQPPWDMGQVEFFSPNRFQRARLIPACCLKLLKLRFPVHEYVSRLRNKEDPAPPQAADTYVAVTRRDFVIRRTSLSWAQYLLLSALVNGSPVQDAIRQAAQSFDGDADDFAESLRDWFSDWGAAGFFRGISFA
jgi:hypothetical protein